MKTRTDVINILFEKYNFQTYLEIGVRVPSDNFNKIKSTLKHSVDPNPSNEYTYNVTSDDFFENCVGDQKYDVIFIDGLHTEEQSYKDAINSIKHLNTDGFIIMHDCNPANEYLTRSHDEYLKTGGGWNGTIYKSFIRLKNELKDWSCFVVDENYGCGVLTKRKIFKNVQFNIGDISWEYFDKNRKNILQLITFDEYEKIIALWK